MKSIVSLMIFALIISLSAQMFFPLAFADAPKYEKVLKIVGGVQSDQRVFTYNGHNVSKGFAVGISMMAAVEPNEWSFSKAGFAVSLASGWGEDQYSYEPRVSAMWVKVQGDSNFRIDTGGIADNTGTGGSCTVSWAVLLEVLETILPYVLEHLAEQPPLTEWQSDLHWAEAIDRSKPAYEGGHLNPTYNPGVETAGCDFNSLFLQKGYQYLTITAGADISLVYGYWARGDYWVWDLIPIGTYSVTFQVEVPVTNEPETPSTPSGPTSGYRGTSYTYSTATIDPDGDNVRYQFDWGDGSTTMTVWYASGATASASHSWSSLGTYNVMVRAQDVYEEWSCWSPSLNVNIVNRVPNTPSTPSGPTSGYRNVWYTYSTTATDPDGDNIRYEFEFSGPIPTVSFTTGWYASGQTGSLTVMWETTDPPGTYYVRARAQDVYGAWSGWSAPLQVSIRDPILSISASWGGTTNPAPGTYSYYYGTSVTVTATPSSGYYFAYWLLDSTTYYYSNPITVTMTADHSLKAYFYYSSGGGDGCPTLFVWNGTAYVDYGIIDIHNPSGEDVVREVSIAKQDLAVEDSKVKIRLQEGWLGLNFSESEIDQVKLYAVDNHGNSLSCPLKKATCNGDNVRPILKESDDVKLNIYLLETVDLEFLVPYGDVQGFTFVIEGCNMYKM